jgi:hypothetical protein
VRCCCCRWHNRSSLLLSLPLGVLRIVTHRAGKAARLACSTLRDAHGTPGSGLRLSHPKAATPATSSVDAILRAWPQPSDVTQLRALPFLPASTCDALARTFPSLRALTILGGMEACEGLAPGGVTRLVLASGKSPADQRDPLQGCTRFLSACSRHFTALRSLCVTGCKHKALLADLSPLASLAQLTSLTLTKQPSHLLGGRKFPPGDGEASDEVGTCGTGAGCVGGTHLALGRIPRNGPRASI